MGGHTARKLKQKEPASFPLQINAGVAMGEATTMQGWLMLLVGTGEELRDAQGRWIVQSPGMLAALDFYKSFYAKNGRIPHFLNKDGTIPTEPEFSEVWPPPQGAGPEWGTFGGAIMQGEARVYAQVARLALLLGDEAFATKIVSEKVLTDQEKDKTSVRFGYIGTRTAGDDDADGFNVLESILALSMQQRATAMVRQDAP